MIEDHGDQIRRRMAETRSRIAWDVQQVAEVTRSAVDWRNYVRRYPWMLVGAGTVLGYLLVPTRARVVVRRAERLPSNLSLGTA